MTNCENLHHPIGPGAGDLYFVIHDADLLMQQYLVYSAYLVAAVGALAVLLALPAGPRPARRGLVFAMLALTAGGLVLFFTRLMAPQAAGATYFHLLGLLALGGAVRVVTHPRPVYSALYFILVVLSTAGLLVLAGAEFLAAALVVVYAGAILVTYVFVIMLAQQNAPASGGQFGASLDYDRNAREPFAAVLAGFVLVATIAGVLVGRHDMASVVPATVPAGGNTMAVGRVLLLDFAVSVQVAGVLLMIAMIGAIALARKKLPLSEDLWESERPGEIGKRVKPF